VILTPEQYAIIRKELKDVQVSILVADEADKDTVFIAGDTIKTIDTGFEF